MKVREYLDFHIVRRALRSRRESRPPGYLVPKFLCQSDSLDTSPVDVGDPFAFFADLFDRILANAAAPVARRGFCHTDHIYQGFPRTFASLDGRIGTALTQIAFLPFLRERLRVSVFICLPSGKIGQANRKGGRGSPFAVSNPFDIDASLADALLPEVPPIVQYRALGQACELLGIRFGSIVPMSTLAIDSPIFAALPELGFWWRADPGELVRATRIDQEMSRRPDLAAPALDTGTATRFVPAPSAVTTIASAAGAYHVASDSLAGNAVVTLANAYPDVLAGDAGTYTWGDVASIRYGHAITPQPAGQPGPAARPSGLPAWGLMPAVLAWRYHELGERVFLIDVSPGIPPALIRRARSLCSAWDPAIGEGLHRLGAGAATAGDAGQLLSDLRRHAALGARHPVDDVTFIAEELWNFDLPGSEYDAVCGPLPYCVSAHTRNMDVMVRSLSHHLRVLQDREADGYFLAAVANHDTMPAVPWAAALLRVIYHFLPGALPLTFSGTEWAADIIVNKEFGFDSAPELLRLREGLGDDALALFNDMPLDWKSVASQDGQVGLIARLAALSRYLGDMRHWEYRMFAPDQEVPDRCFGYIRSASGRDRRQLIVLANWDEASIELEWAAPSARRILAVGSGAVPAVFPGNAAVVLPGRAAVVALAT